jgi:hypothetical protein
MARAALAITTVVIAGSACLPACSAPPGRGDPTRAILDSLVPGELPVHGDVGYLRPRVGRHLTLEGEAFGGKVPNRLKLTTGGSIHLARALPDELEGKRLRLSGVLHEGQAVYDPDPAKRFELGGYTPAYPGATQPVRYIYLYLYDFTIDSVWDGGAWRADGREMR